MPARQDLLLGQLAVKNGYLTEGELSECVRQQEAAGASKPLGDLLVEQGYLSDTQLKALLAQQQANFQKAQAAPDPVTKEDATFGRLVLGKLLVSQQQLNEALRAQASDPSHPRLGEVLVRKGYLKPDQVQKVLASQNKVVVECPGCRTAFNIAGASEGQTLKCRACGRVMKVRSVAGRLDVVETVVVPPSPPGQRFGPFELFGELGRGSMAVVYKGKDTRTGRAVALKVLARQSKVTEVDIERFRREAEAAAALKHPNIVAALEVGTEAGQHWIAMDLVAGRSLDLMLQTAPLPAQKAASIARDVARALGHAHASGIVHRDVKPGNILVDAAGKGYLTDFGLARTLNKRALRLAGSGAAVGTPLYMSPEQAMGDQRSVDGRSDVYSLGAVLYEMVSGSPPVSGDSVQQILDAVVRRPPAPLPRGTPAGLAAVVHLAMQKEKELRYASAGEMADDLERFLGGRRVHARPPGGMKRLGVLVRRNRLAVSIAAGTLVVAAVLVAVVLRQNRADEAARADAAKKAEKDRDDFDRDIAERLRKEAEARKKSLQLAHECLAAKKWDAALDALVEAGKMGPETVEMSLVRAEALFGKKDRASMGILDGILASDPKNADAHWLCARIWLASGKPSKALPELDAAIAARPRLVEALLARARVRDDAGDVAGAKADGEAALAADATNPSARLYRAKGRRVAGDIAGAREDVEAYLAAFPSDPAGYVERGLQRAACVEMREALADLATALEKEPSNRVALLERGRLLAAMGDLAQAEHDFTQAIALGPDDPGPYVERGEVYRIRGDRTNARTDYGEALDHRKGYPPALVGLGRIVESEGKLDAAETDYTQALTADPGCAAAWYHRGRLQAKRGNDRAALADLINASGRSEAVREVFAWTGIVYGGRFPLNLLEREMQSPFQTALRRDDRLPPVKGWMRMLAGDWDGALAGMKGATQGASAPDPLVLLGVGIAEMEKREHNEAIKDLTAAADRDPRLAMAHLFLARTYLLLGRTEQAELALARAREISPRSPLVLDTMGLLAVTKHDLAAAQACFAGVVYADPLWAEPRTLHGAARWLEQGLYSERGQADALPDFEEAVSLEWRSPEALLARGSLRLNSGRKQEALADAEAAVKVRPDDPIFQFLHGQALIETGRQMEGLAILVKAEQMMQQKGSPTFLGQFLTPLANFARGEGKLLLGDVDGAEKAYKEAEAGYFAESEAEFGLAKVRLARRDYDGAWEYLKRSKKHSSELVGKLNWDQVVKALETASGKKAADMLKE